jgi:aminoglycoside phosphotransferase (APT) family kinase protein
MNTVTATPSIPAPSFELLNDPPPEFADGLRRSFPTERETERQLERKLRRRASGPYTPVNLEAMCEALRRLIGEHTDDPFEVLNPRWFTGGASKVQMGFELRWDRPGRGPSVDGMMVRMDPAESHNATSKLREFELLGAVRPVMPVPEVYWVDDDAEYFPHPALVYALADGVTKPQHATTGQVSGMGTNFGPSLRVQLAPQFMEYLAVLHTFDYASAALPSFDVPRTGTSDAALWELNRSRRLWEEDRGQDLPVMEVAAAWLERNLPTLDAVSVVHGDYRSGNFLFDEDSGRITCWLDFERAHLGDRHRDLAWTTQRIFGHYAEGGSPYLICGLIPIESFYEQYERATGLPVDPQRLQFYRVLDVYSMIVSTLASAYRVVRLGKTHQDIVLTRVRGMVGILAEELCELLEEVL